MNYKKLAGNRIPANFIENLALTNPIPNTYLFSGPKDCGKKLTALQLYKMSTCLEDHRYDCGCSCCLKIDKAISPDVFSIQTNFEFKKILYFYELSEKNNRWDDLFWSSIHELSVYLRQFKQPKTVSELINDILLTRNKLKMIQKLDTFNEIVQDSNHTPTEFIRDVMERINYHPVENRYRLLVINDVSELSEDQSNIMLKTIEEPPAFLIIIAITSKLHKVLPTIRSRAILLKFRKYTPQDLEELTESFNHLPYPREKDDEKDFNLASANKEDALGYIDFQKGQYSLNSVVDQEKLDYLTKLTLGLKYYNVPLAYARKALELIQKKTEQKL
jgi:DNA polymerase III delta prime subunit